MRLAVLCNEIVHSYRHKGRLLSGAWLWAGAPRSLTHASIRTTCLLRTCVRLRCNSGATAEISCQRSESFTNVARPTWQIIELVRTRNDGAWLKTTRRVGRGWKGFRQFLFFRTRLVVLWIHCILKWLRPNCFQYETPQVRYFKHQIKRDLKTLHI